MIIYSHVFLLLNLLTHFFFFKIAMPAREEPYMWQMTPTGACLSPSECFIQSLALYGTVSDVQ